VLHNIEISVNVKCSQVKVQV